MFYYSECKQCLLLKYLKLKLQVLDLTKFNQCIHKFLLIKRLLFLWWLWIYSSQNLLYEREISLLPILQNEIKQKQVKFYFDLKFLNDCSILLNVLLWKFDFKSLRMQIITILSTNTLLYIIWEITQSHIFQCCITTIRRKHSRIIEYRIKKIFIKIRRYLYNNIRNL